MSKHSAGPVTDDPASPEAGRDTHIAELEKRLRETEMALRLSRGQLRIALDIGKLGAWERDLETGEVTGSPTFRACLGLPPDVPLTYHDIQQTFHPADVERIEQAVSFALRTKTDFNVEHRVIRPEGRVGHVLVRGNTVYDGDRPTRIFGIVWDTSEREKLKEEANLFQSRQEFLLKLNDQLGDLDDPYTIMETASRNTAQYLKLDMAGYGEVYLDRGVVVVEREWSRGALGNEGNVQQIDQIPQKLKELVLEGRLFTIDDVKTDPLTDDPWSQTFYSSLNVRTVAGVPLVKNGRIAAIFYLQSSQPHQWQSDEIALIADVADRAWIAVEKARTERELRETEERFQIIAESLPALVWILNPNTELTYTNNRWVQYSGLPPEEALGHSWTHSLHPDDWARMQEELKDVVSNHTPYETEARYRSAEGAYRWHLIQGAPVHSVTGKFKGWVGTSVDIHDRKETEKALRASEERLSLAQRAAGIGVFDWDIPSGKMTWTAEQEYLFDLEPGTFKGDFADWTEKILPEDLEPATKVIQEALARHEAESNFSYRVRRPDGTVRIIDTLALFFYDADDNPLRMVGVNLDITRYKQAEQRQQLLIRELHHRVKNTLATVQAIVGSTARTTSSIEEFYQGFVGRIVSLARTHNILTEDYWQKASLEELIQTELGPYEDETRNRITVEGPAIELPSEAAVPIGMAVHELTTNAAKHGALSTFGGQVDVKWTIDKTDGEKPILTFSWTERGGPRVISPTRQGFGSRLLQRVLTTQLGAEVDMDFGETGLRFRMTMSIPGEPPLFNPDA